MSEQEIARIRLLMGTTGSGKTYMMRELLRQEPRVFLFDMMSDPKFEDFGVWCENVSDAVALARKTEKFRIRLSFKDEDQFDFLCSLMVRKPEGLEAFKDCTLAIDELAIFTTPHYIPEGLENLVRFGRHTGAKLIATTQRPPDINIFIRSQCKENYLFQMHEKADLDTFRNRLPDVEQLVRLKIGEHILWNPSAR
jgi:hypothetical protein